MFYTQAQGETMYEYLKRKKKYNLQQEIGKSKHKDRDSRIQQTTRSAAITPARKLYDRKSKSPEPDVDRSHRAKSPTPTSSVSAYATPRDTKARSTLQPTSKYASLHASVEDTVCPEVERYPPKPAQKHPLQHQSHKQSVFVASTGLKNTRNARPADSVSDQRDRNNNSRSKSKKNFLEIVSPFRKRLSNLNQGDTHKDISTTRDRGSTSTTRRVLVAQFDKRQTNPERRQLDIKLQRMASTVYKYTDKTTAFRNQSWRIVADAVGFLSRLHQEGDLESGAAVKAKQIKASLKTLEKIAQELDVCEPNQEVARVLEDAYGLINQLQSNTKQYYQRICNNHIEAISRKSQQTIQTLEQDLERQMRECQKLQRAVEKIQSSESTFRNKATTKEEETTKNFKDRIADYQGKIQHFQTQTKQQSQYISELQAQKKILEREKKTLQFEKDSLIKSFEIQRQEVIAGKQALLLKEISSLKGNFKLEIEQLRKMYQLKEQHWVGEVNKLQLLLKDEQARNRQILKDTTYQSDEVAILNTQIVQLREEAAKLSREIDLQHEQCFIYWAALKDIKILSSRLGLFPKFCRIYEDIKFDDIGFK